MYRRDVHVYARNVVTLYVRTLHYRMSACMYTNPSTAGPMPTGLQDMARYSMLKINCIVLIQHAVSVTFLSLRWPTAYTARQAVSGPSPSEASFHITRGERRLNALHS